MAATRPPKTKDPNLDTWLQDFAYNFYNWIKVIDVSVVGNINTHGKYPTKQLAALGTGYFSFFVPTDIQAVKEVVIRFIPTTSGTMNYTANTTYAAVGEDEALNSSTLSETNVAVVDDQISEIDVTALFSDVDAQDQVGVELVIDSLTTTTSIEVLGLYFKYI